MWLPPILLQNIWHAKFSLDFVEVQAETHEIVLENTCWLVSIKQPAGIIPKEY